MPIYDRVCEDGHQQLDLYEKIEHPVTNCPTCGKPSPRALLPGRVGNVIPDDIPGGIEIRHGICNEDGSPKRYYSRSEIAKAAKAKGLFQLVEHVTEPGTDKNKHTTKWV